MLVSKVVISTSRKMGPECARGQEVVNVPVISIFTAGRSVAANDALCVEVLKTSAGLGLSLDGGKSSMSRDGPLFIKRVYKGNVLENPIHCPLPISFSAFHLEIKFVLKSLKCFSCFTTYI